jgi:hypothetical protein
VRKNDAKEENTFRIVFYFFLYPALRRVNLKQGLAGIVSCSAYKSVSPLTGFFGFVTHHHENLVTGSLSGQGQPAYIFRIGYKCNHLNF